MRIAALAVVLLIGGALPGHSQTRIDSISTNFRWLGPNDKIVVERYDDPKVANVSCYMSRADTGGIKGGLGLAEDPSRFSIACRAVGPIAIPSGLRKSEVIGFSYQPKLHDCPASKTGFRSNSPIPDLPLL
jgi:CreA protein